MPELDADALVVRPLVVERVGQVPPARLRHGQRPRHAGGLFGARVFAHHLQVLDLFGRHAGR